MDTWKTQIGHENEQSVEAAQGACNEFLTRYTILMTFPVYYILLPF